MTVGTTSKNQSLSDGTLAQLPGLQPRASVEDRMKAGRAQGSVVPQSAHSRWSPPADRKDPVRILTGQDRHRIATLVPVRYGRMLESPLAFFRGAAAVMASDLAVTAKTDITTQLVGDAHLLNFRAYRTPERSLVFDVNDFDETLPGPFEWDIKRLAASIVVAGRTNGFRATDCSQAARAAVDFYRQRMAIYALIGNLALYHTHVEVDSLMDIVSGRKLNGAQRDTQNAGVNCDLGELNELSAVVNGELCIVDDPPIVTHVDDWSVLGAERGARFFRAYYDTLQPDRRHLFERYRLVDAAQAVVGIEGVGTRCFVLLFEGASDDDLLVLQIKEATASVLEPYLGASSHKHHGERVVAGQRMIQAAGDIFLGWGTTSQGQFYLRQVRDKHAAVDLGAMAPAELVAYAEVCGWTLALAHARAGDAAIISGYLGSNDTFDIAITHFANAYADQNERDYQALVEAEKVGRITADVGL